VYQGEEARDWSRRYKANLEKLGCGDLAEVAEVVVILSFESAKLVSAPGGTHARQSAARAAASERGIERRVRARSSSQTRGGISHNFLTNWPDDTGLWPLCRTPKRC
jgi:hypothetical protein